ncbi:MAG TPA: DNA repair exonuclease [Candidatus Saccharimonadales bacterium]|nr:DNA repair exonuclease [Candidatus Saccharimonadales bacterium]
MASLKFLQLSDLHLDSSLATGGLGLSSEQIRVRQGEIRGILPRACNLARERNVDLVLLPGDLFDDEAVRTDTVNFAVSALGGLAPVPVLIAPGNHDFYSLGSPYNDQLLEARRQEPWPGNVHIFRSAAWQIWSPPGGTPVAVTGMAHAAGAAIGERLIAGDIPAGDAHFRILIFHGSRDNTDLPRKKMRTLPFSDENLAARGFDYAAIGHYHESTIIEGPDGRILGAYAGVPAGRGLDETGQKSVLIGEIEKAEPHAPARVNLERVPLDQRRIHVIDVPCTGLTHQAAILKRADEHLALREVKAEDMVVLRFSGRAAPGIDLRIPDGFLADRFFHAVVDTSNLRPAYDLQRYRREELRTTEARFAREMLRRMEDADDPARRRLIENALYYGLDALIQKEVVPRYEE